jgi:hypothetical protein
MRNSRSFPARGKTPAQRVILEEAIAAHQTHEEAGTGEPVSKPGNGQTNGDRRMSFQRGHSVVPICLSSQPFSKPGGRLEFTLQRMIPAGLIFLPANLSAMIFPGHLNSEPKAETGGGLLRNAASRLSLWQKDLSAEKWTGAEADGQMDDSPFIPAFPRQPGFERASGENHVGIGWTKTPSPIARLCLPLSSCVWCVSWAAIKCRRVSRTGAADKTVRSSGAFSQFHFAAADLTLSAR